MQNKKLIIQQISNGPMGNFQYFLGDKATGEIAVVDPAWDMDRLCSEAQKARYKIVAVFLTHGHFDHVNGLDKLLSNHDVPVYISKYEFPLYMPKSKNLHKIEDRAKVQIGSVEFEFIRTPGHSTGCQLIKHGETVVCGDTIFIDGCGRCDLPGSDPKAQYKSLYEIVMKLPDDTVLYPGHDYGPAPHDTVGEQKKTNPYLQCKSLEEFLEQRMGIIL